MRVNIVKADPSPKLTLSRLGYGTGFMFKDQQLTQNIMVKVLKQLPLPDRHNRLNVPCRLTYLNTQTNEILWSTEDHEINQVDLELVVRVS